MVFFHLKSRAGGSLLICTQFSGQTKVKKVQLLRDKALYGGSPGMPCELVEQFLLELNAENKDAEFMMDYDTRKQLKSQN